jgi:glycosyltransferase involved in cell wall biosynthesis
VIHNHFIGKIWQATVPVVGRMAGAHRLITSVHNVPQHPERVRWVYDRYHQVLPVSDAVGASLAAAGADQSRMRTLYLGLFGDRGRDAASGRELRHELGLPQDATVVGCIAWSASFKGVDLLLHAFEEVTRSRKDVYLLQVGVAEEDVELRRLAHDLGIDDRVVWAGIVDDGWQLLDAADVYVQPSRSSEGLPLALMEAMAMSLPIACTRVSGNVEAIIDGETGLVADPNPEGLARTIDELLSRSEEWNTFGGAARDRYLRLFDGQSSVDTLVSEVYGIARST